MDSAAFRVLTLAALARGLERPGERVILVTGLPVEDIEPHGATLRRQLEGEHEVRLEPGGRAWRVAIGPVHVVPQPLGTVLAQLLDARGQLSGREGLEGRVGVLDVGFRTTDYFTLDGLEVVPAHCLTRNTGLADLLLDLGREVYRRWGVEVDPHALDEPVLRGRSRSAARPLRSARSSTRGSTGTPRRSRRTRACCGGTARAAWPASGSPAGAARCSAPGSRPSRRTLNSCAMPGGRTPWGTSATASGSTRTRA
jgi:Actin like proteins N terminal domain